MGIRFAYLAEDKLFLQDGDSPARPVDSPFAQGVIEREVRDRQRNEWKTQGANAAFGRGLPPWAMRTDDAGTRRVFFTGLTAGTGELLYALSTGPVGGLFVHNLADGTERRVFHRNGFRARDLSCRADDGTIALSLQGDDGTANLAIVDAGGRGVREVTEGDSVDQSPAWVPGDKRRLVFQSAGIGRNRLGHAAALGPYAVQQLDLEGGEITTLLEAERTDYLCPKVGADGSLYCIRRPYRSALAPVNPLRVLLDVLLFPFRLARAIVHFFNFFSVMFSGKPLLTAGGPAAQPTDRRHLMLWGKMIDAEKALRTAKNGDAPSLVPSDWELLCRSSDGAERVIARGVLSFDLSGNRIVYSNGSAVFELGPDGEKRQLCRGKMIEHLVVAGV
jgi:hypothetical protein